jgi:large-conductance mechanosensitive channel MscL
MMRRLLTEFRQFILRGNVVDLAVGIVIGVAFTGAAVFFLVIKPVNLMIDRFRLSPASPSPATKTCPDCFTDIPAKARRCPNCTSELSPSSREEAPASA